jgi:hypothetical protein
MTSSPSSRLGHLVAAAQLVLDGVDHLSISALVMGRFTHGRRMERTSLAPVEALHLPSVLMTWTGRSSTTS